MALRVLPFYQQPALLWGLKRNLLHFHPWMKFWRCEHWHWIWRLGPGPLATVCHLPSAMTKLALRKDSQEIKSKGMFLAVLWTGDSFWWCYQFSRELRWSVCCSFYVPNNARGLKIAKQVQKIQNGGFTISGHAFSKWAIFGQRCMKQWNKIQDVTTIFNLSYWRGFQTKWVFCLLMQFSLSLRWLKLKSDYWGFILCTNYWCAGWNGNGGK